MNKLKLLILFLILCLSVKTIHAADSTSAAEIEKSLQERIKKAIQDNLPAAQQEVTSKATTGQFKAFVGTIESISAKTITINTSNGIRQAIVNDQTTIVNQGKSGAKFADLPIGFGIIALGKTTDLQTQTATKIIVYPAPTITPRQIVTAKILDFRAAKKTIILESNLTTKEDVITISTKNQYFTAGLQKLSPDKISANQKVIAVLHQDDNDFTLTRLILLSPTTTCGDKTCTSPETPETCPSDCQN